MNELKRYGKGAGISLAAMYGTGKLVSNVPQLNRIFGESYAIIFVAPAVGVVTTKFANKMTWGEATISTALGMAALYAYRQLVPPAPILPFTPKPAAQVK